MIFSHPSGARPTKAYVLMSGFFRIMLSQQNLVVQCSIVGLQSGNSCTTRSLLVLTMCKDNMSQ